MKRIILATILLFSSTTFSQTWEQMGDAIAVRHHPISFSLDGKGYAVTGSSSSDDPTNDVYEYDPTTDTWTTLADFPGEERSFGIGVVNNGLAYIGFGASNFNYLNDLWSFDASTGTWTQLASCGCSGRRHPAMITIGNKIYVGLGDGFAGNFNDWWMYNIDANTWTQTADLPGPVRHHPFMFNAGGEVFAGMGHGGPTIYKDWYKLDTTTNTWTAMNDFPGEARVAGTQFSIDSFGYVLSGDGDDHSYMNSGEMWRYDPSDDSWVQFPSHPGQSRWAPGSFVIDKDIYFFGGLNRLTNTFPADVWKYADTTTVIPPDTSMTSIISAQVLANTYVYPNPASQRVSLEMDKSITSFKVYNNLGQLVSTRSSKSPRINTISYEEGIYFVRFYTESTLVKTQRLIIRH